VENRPLIGTDYPPLVSTANSAEWLSAPYGSVSVRGKLYRGHTIDYYKLYLATEMAHPGFRGAGGGVRGVRPSCPIADYLDCVTFRKNGYLSMDWPIRNQVKAWLQAIDLRGNGRKS